MNSDLTYKLLRYLVQGIIIYLLFKFVPKEPMSDKDIILITTIVVLTYAVVENVYSVYFPTKDTSTTSDTVTASQCNSYCSRPQPQAEQTEHMGNLSDSVKSVLQNVAFVAPQHIQNVKPAQPAQPVQPNVLNHLIQHPSPQHVQNAKPAQPVQHVEHPAQHVQQQPVHHDAIHNNRNGSHTIKPNHELAHNYVDYNSMPVSYDTGSFESGYSFLPPEKWYPVPPHPPVCVTEQKCPVCPVFTNGTDISLKEWNQSRKIMPVDNIHFDGIE